MKMSEANARIQASLRWGKRACVAYTPHNRRVKDRCKNRVFQVGYVIELGECLRFTVKGTSPTSWERAFRQADRENEQCQDSYRIDRERPLRLHNEPIGMWKHRSLKRSNAMRTG